jgi:hypothetical protein
MTYKQILKRDLTGLTGYGYLYLYFPSNFEESSKFYIFHYFYLEPKGKQLEINLDEFHSVVNGFTLK